MIAVMIGMAMSVSAQSESKYGADSVACVTNMSMYREYFKQWEAAKFAPESFSPEMVSAWREVFLNCPRASQLTYTNGEKIMDYYIRTNPSQKDAYIDTLCMLMDQRAQYFPNDPKTGTSQVASIMGRKGLLIYSYNKNRYEEAYNVLKNAVALDPSQLQGAYIDTYFKATIDMVNNGKAEKMEVINVYQELSEVLDNNIGTLAENVVQLEEAKVTAEDSGDADAVAGFDKQIEKNDKSINNNKVTKSNLDNLFQPFASCEDLIKVFSAKMAETPDDVTLLKRITTILDKKDCTESKLFLDAAVKLNELEPSPEASYSLGIKFFKDKKYSDAATFFEQATKTENNDRKYRAYRNLGMCYQNMGNLSRARETFRRSAQIDPTNGEPYLLIAMLYAESTKQFSDEIESKAVFWAAVDKCIKAKSIDPTCAEKANSLIRSYSQFFPSMETIFFNDYSEGSPFNVGGWIGETTTIRAKK
jgi:tetratricopeptide (TPR) repeat protein